MKKRILILLSALALLAGCLVVSSMAADTTHTAYCQYCKTSDVTWEPVAFGEQKLPEGQTQVHKHYYLDKDYTQTSDKQISLPAGVTVCLDLNGNDWNAWGRAFNTYTGSILNVMDSKGGGTITCTSITGANNASGGVGFIRGTMNIYGGTYSLKVADENNLYTTRGGIFNITGGVVNLYDGTLIGAKISRESGAVYMDNQAQFNAYGGTVTAGISTGGKGGCIGVNSSSCVVRLGGDAEVAEIRYYWHKNTSFVVEDGYTGKASILFDKTVDKGTVVGICNGDISGAQILCTNGSGFSVVADGTALKLGQLSAPTVLKYCLHCDQTVSWTYLKNSKALFGTEGHHHIILSESYTGSQLSVANGANVCLDLCGNYITTDGRAFHISANSQLNIMDSVGGGTVTGTSAGNNPTGGVLALSSDSAVCNIYGGTFRAVQDGTGFGIGTGGVVYLNYGTLNLYGGKLEGAELVISSYELTINGYGAAIFMGNSAKLNVYDGEITSGKVPDGGLGSCVYLASSTAKVFLSGNGSVEEIYCQKNAQPLTVTGKYTGTVNLRFPDTQTIIEEMVVGVCNNADIAGGSLKCVNGNGYSLAVKGAELVISSYGLDAVAAVCNSTGGTGYQTLQAAIEACVDGYVKLLKTTDQTANVTKDICIDLNSHSATLTAAEGVTVYGFDCHTDDYTVADGKYGKLTLIGGQATGLPVESEFAKDGYLAVTENGSYSFHRVTLQIYAMSLRPDVAGLFYKSHFLADEKAAAQITNYGVALSVVEMPTAENMDEACVSTVFTGFESGPIGNIGNTSSTQLKGIVKESNSEYQNRKNLAMPVHGRAYATTTDGRLLLGQPVSRSLEEQLHGVNAIMESLSDVQVQGAARLYSQYKPLLQELNLYNIAAAAEQGQKGTLKVLSLGHSHGLDGTTLLYEVFDKELTDQEVVVGALYYSGCSMAQHAQFLTNNSPVYDYHKMDKTNVNGVWTTTKNVTALHALQDEQWDVIVIQDANFQAGQQVSYNVDQYMTVIRYLYNNQEHKPRLLFHMTWTNPDDYATYINPNSTLSHPNQGWYRPYMETHYSDASGVYQREILIDKILSNTEMYLEDCTQFLGQKYIENVIPAATAVEYAQYVCGRTDAQIYRDWTHMNDYGRLIVAYCWYARIMCLDSISEVNVDEVPKGSHNSNSKYPADLKFDAEMKEDLIASVNFALSNPYTDIANGDPIPQK